MAFFYRRSGSPIRPYDSTPSSSGSGSSSSSSSSTGSSTSTSNNDDSSPLSMLPSVIPDLRFEQSYLASIRGFIHELDPQEADREKRQAAAKGEVEDDDDTNDCGVESRTLQASDEKRAGLPRKEDEETPTLILGEKKTGPDHHGEPELWIGRLRIDWLPLLRVTLRDQILSPLIQGTFWAVVGVFLGQARGVVGAAWAQRRYRNRLRREEAAAAASNAPAGGHSSTRYI